MTSGRKSRSARARRRENERQEAARYRRLYARARTLAFEPAELNDAIGQQPGLLDVALTSRYAARRTLFGRCPELLQPHGRTVLALIPAADAALARADAGWSPAPDCWGRTTWPDMLRWGLDKAADTCRLLRVGLTFGALVLARARPPNQDHERCRLTRHQQGFPDSRPQVLPLTCGHHGWSGGPWAFP